MRRQGSATERGSTSVRRALAQASSVNRASRSTTSYMACSNASSRVLPQTSPVLVARNTSGCKTGLAAERWTKPTGTGTRRRLSTPLPVVVPHSGQLDVQSARTASALARVRRIRRQCRERQADEQNTPVDFTDGVSGPPRPRHNRGSAPRPSATTSSLSPGVPFVLAHARHRASGHRARLGGSGRGVVVSRASRRASGRSGSISRVSAPPIRRCLMVAALSSALPRAAPAPLSERYRAGKAGHRSGCCPGHIASIRLW